MRRTLVLQDCSCRMLAPAQRGPQARLSAQLGLQRYNSSSACLGVSASGEMSRNASSSALSFASPRGACGANSGRSSMRASGLWPSRPSSSARRTSSARADHRRRQARQLGHVNAVGAVGHAGRHLVQEHDGVVPFPHPHGDAGERRQALRQRRHFVVVRGEQRAATCWRRTDARPLPRRSRAHRRSLCRGRSRRG